MKEVKIHRWIDVSKLPRQNGTNNIDWMKSIGIALPFEYGDVTGTINILEYVKNTKKNKLKVLINTEHFQKEYLIMPVSLRTCALKDALRLPISCTHPHLVDFFKNKHDTFIYTACSGALVSFVCPICGAQKVQRIIDFVEFGFSCPICGDGMSYPEKLMLNILGQLNINFTTQVSKVTPGFEWIDGKYRYDFYIDHNGQKYFVEIDGRFHKKENVKSNDSHKDTLANNHNIKMIRIDCDYPSFKQRLNFIKNNIADSELSKIIQLDSIDWEAANNYATQSNIIIASNLWEKDKLYLDDISVKIGVSENTVREYLKLGAELNLCKYSRDEAIKRKVLKFGDIVLVGRNKQIVVFKNNATIGVFFNASELSKLSYNLFGIHFNANSIASTCTGRRKSYFGYCMKYITYDEYMQLLPKFQQYKINK